ncbi:uncharacterized protein [Arachis hypogaea]|uniref:uncharacterized protein n=1 Tax=Arachis hypogaea TaxID=3818 RepID=UPI003B21B29A
MVTIHITLVISHREKFEKGDDGKLAYVGGEKTEIERVNVDTLNRFFMNDLVKDIGYNDVSELYWLEPGKELDGGLRLLRLDMDVVSMYEAAIANGRRVEVFTENPVDLPEFAEENNEPESELEILTVNRTPVKHRTKLCVRRPPTPKKKRKRVVKLSETAQTEDVAGETEVHHTPRNTQQPEFSNDQPNIPTHSPKVTFDEAPRIIQLSDPPTEPNLPPYQPPENTHTHPEQPDVSAASEETGNQIPVSAESVAPTVDKGPAESVEVFTQYIPQPCQEPGTGSQPSSSQPEPDINPDEGGGSQQKSKRRSTVRPPPSGQTFIPNQDPNKHPSFYIPVDGENMSEASAGMHCYESEELDSVASDDEDSEQVAFPQANPDAPVREVRLELGMEFENLDHFKKAVRKFNINLGRSIFFPRVDSTRCKAICYDESCLW